jgi:hypothetical protein
VREDSEKADRKPYEEFHLKSLLSIKEVWEASDKDCQVL